MREKINEHFLAAKWGVEPDEIDLLEAGGRVIHGDNQDYINLLGFIQSADLSSPGNYDFVRSQIDVENYALYQAAQIYFDNQDWPGNNIKYARHQGGKWRWILFDTDFGFGIWNDFNYVNNTLGFALEPNGPGWPNPPWSTFLFRKLTESTQFRNLFVNRFADELNSRFLPGRVSVHIDSLAAKIKDEIPAHFDRWNGPAGNWQNRITAMKTFANVRQSYVKQQILSEFGLPAHHKLTIEIAELAAGWVQVNSLQIEENNWSGDYFQNVPIVVTAQPKPGYVLSHWLGLPDISTEPSLEINMQAAMALRPVFQASNESVIHINEINYNAADDVDPGDWVELYNASFNVVDLSEWVMKDDDDTHSFTIPAGTLIEPNGFLVLTRDQTRFLSEFSNIESVIGDFDFGLSKDGDAVRLYDADEKLVDEVYYLPDAPWPTLADGGGYTLELLSPRLDNSLPESWAAVNVHGSPDQANTEEEPNDTPGEAFQILSFPNPFFSHINLALTLEETAQVDIELFDQKGRAIQQIGFGILGADQHYLYADLSYLKAGLYFAKVQVGDQAPRTLKWMKQ